MTGGSGRDVSGAKVAARSRELLLGELYGSHAQALLSWFLHRTLSAEVAADLCAETFAVALEHAGEHDPDRGEPGAWLWGIAKNLLRRFHRTEAVDVRARERLRIRTPMVTEDDFAVLDARLDARAALESLAGAIDALPDKLAVALQSRVIDGNSYEVVAAECSCSVGAARVRVSRALTMLFDAVEDPELRQVSP